VVRWILVDKPVNFPIMNFCVDLDSFPYKVKVNGYFGGSGVSVCAAKESPIGKVDSSR
jgi:hypothetical protein